MKALFLSLITLVIFSPLFGQTVINIDTITTRYMEVNDGTIKREILRNNCRAERTSTGVSLFAMDVTVATWNYSNYTFKFNGHTVATKDSFLYYITRYYCLNEDTVNVRLSAPVVVDTVVLPASITITNDSSTLSRESVISTIAYPDSSICTLYSGYFDSDTTDSVPAGCTYIQFQWNSSYAGTINGVNHATDTGMMVISSTGFRLPAVPFTRTAGKIRYDAVKPN